MRARPLFFAQDLLRLAAPCRGHGPPLGCGEGLVIQSLGWGLGWVKGRARQKQGGHRNLRRNSHGVKAADGISQGVTVCRFSRAVPRRWLRQSRFPLLGAVRRCYRSSQGLNEIFIQQAGPGGALTSWAPNTRHPAGQRPHRARRWGGFRARFLVVVKHTAAHIVHNAVKTIRHKQSRGLL